MPTQQITGIMFRNMVKSGAAFLRLHCDEVNDLNVFPISETKFSLTG